MVDNNINYKELYEKLIIENQQLKEHLKKYTAPKRNKNYYENHKEEIIKKVKEYKEKTRYDKKPLPEKIKEYSKRAYIKRKQKLLEDNNI
jgi:hypothetical protein